MTLQEMVAKQKAIYDALPKPKFKCDLCKKTDLFLMLWWNNKVRVCPGCDKIIRTTELYETLIEENDE